MKVQMPSNEFKKKNLKCYYKLINIWMQQKTIN